MEVEATCSKDISRFCADVPKGRGAIRKCLHAYFDHLEGSRSTAQFKPMAMQSEDLSLFEDLARECKSMEQKFCADVSAISRIPCLLVHMHDSDMTPSCRSELVKERCRQSLSAALGTAQLSGWRLAIVTK